MAVTISSPVKINLILRVYSKLENGYHEIYSLFWQKMSEEKLTIQKKYGEITGDSLNITGIKIEGVNLVERVLAAARKRGEIPPLAVTLEKIFPAGSGIGAGSGNAGALLKWLAASYGAALGADETAALGADVTFLASDWEFAEARGIGERMKPFPKPFDFVWLLVFPLWSSSTGEAYAKLDARRAEGAHSRVERGRGSSDMRQVLSLARGGVAGLLPNDFYPQAAAEHKEYLAAEKIAESTGARGWGLCGSGSAFFALYRKAEEAREAGERFRASGWARKTYIVE